MVVPSLAKLAILSKQTLDQNDGSFASSLQEFKRHHLLIDNETNGRSMNPFQSFSANK
jgi:hypothetical protein